MKKIIGIIFCVLTLCSCGKKSSLTYPDGQELPDYTKVLEGGKQ